MDSFKIARRAESVLFPSNVGIAAGIILVMYLSFYDPALFMNNIAVFVLSVFVYILAIGFTRERISSETKKYTTAATVAMLAFIAASFFIQVSDEMLFCFYSTISVTAIFHFVRDKWKISGHSATYAGVSTVLSLIDYRFLPVFALLPVVAWCRLKLRRHTRMQVAAGIAVGMIVPSIVYVIVM